MPPSPGSASSSVVLFHLSRIYFYSSAFPFFSSRYCNAFITKSIKATQLQYRIQPSTACSGVGSRDSSLSRETQTSTCREMSSSLPNWLLSMGKSNSTPSLSQITELFTLPLKEYRYTERKTWFDSLYLQFRSFGHYPEVWTISGGRDRPVTITNFAG